MPSAPSRNKRWRWIREDVVLAIHDQQIAEHGGPTGVRDRSLLQSALARPQNIAAYEAADAAALAASYAFGICRNHPFVDGNKRVAFATCELFLELNGYGLQASESESVTAILRLADGDLDEKQFAAWLRQHI
jgi:death-on-curing protein